MSMRVDAMRLLEHYLSVGETPWLPWFYALARTENEPRLAQCLPKSCRQPLQLSHGQFNCRSQERVRHVMPGGAVSIFLLRVRLPEEVIPTCSSEPPTTHTPLASTVESGTTKHKSIEAQQDEYGKTHLSILSPLAEHLYWLVKSNGLLAPLDRNVLPKY